jgi:hypothetical protein
MNRYLNALILALGVLLLGSFPAQAGERPFRLNLSGTVTNGVVSATGHATHLGLFTETGELSFVPDPNNPTLLLVTGRVTLTAANGDQLDALIEDAVLDATTGQAAGTVRFIGGTGRFANASGTGDLVIDQNLITGAFEGTAVGRIDY